MASEIRVNKIINRSGLSTVTFSDTGAIVSGIVTANSFSGNVTGAVTGSGANLTSIPAGQLTGTIADARLSTVSSSKLSGALPALDGSALTGVGVGTDGSVNTSGIVTATAFNSDTPFSHRNLIINGQFLVWQRATDSGSNTTDGYLSCDRWYHASSGATKQVTRQTFSPGQTDVPDNPFYYLRYAVTTGNNNVALRQRIEDVTRCQGEMTFSFWVKGSNPGGGNFNLTFRQNFGSGGSSVVDHGIADYTVSNTWTKKTFTFTPPSISGKTVSSNKHTSYYEIELFRQPASDTSTAAFTVDFANVQLERGNTATRFEQKHLADEFRACQRYFQSFQSAYSYKTMLGFNILANSSTVIELMPIWKVDLRTTPTISVTGDQLQARAGISGSANISLSGNNFGHSRELNQIVGHMWFTRSGGDAFVTGSAGRLFAQDAAYISFDSEL